MSPTSQFDFHSLTTAICTGMKDGNRELVDALKEDGKRIHDFRGTLDSNTGKLYEHDTEIKLLKGMLVALMGNGDGSSGIVPKLTGDVATLKQDVGQIKNDMSSMKAGIEEIIKAQKVQGTWTDQVKGGALAARFLIGASVTFITVLLGLVVWFLTHTVTIQEAPKSFHTSTSSAGKLVPDIQDADAPSR